MSSIVAKYLVLSSFCWALHLLFGAVAGWQFIAGIKNRPPIRKKLGRNSNQRISVEVTLGFFIMWSNKLVTIQRAAYCSWL